MACSNCGKPTQTCGCKDGPFTTVPGCLCPLDLNCPVPQKCVENIDSACVSYNDASAIANDISGNIFEVQEGASLEEMVQKLMLLKMNPTCAYSNSPCQSTFHVYPYNIGTTSIAIAWKPSVTALNYQVEYRHISTSTWTLLPVQSANSPLQAVLSPLFSNSIYLVRVNTFCSSGNCYSVTLKINTKP